MLIAIEGIDGSGTSTHARLLVRWLRRRGMRAALTKEPTRGPVGRIIRRLLKQPSHDPPLLALLFAADRRLHVLSIQKQLSSGYVVVSCRYLLSSFAYQVADGLPSRWVEEINRFAPLPDLTIILDVPPEVAAARKPGFGEEVFEQTAFLRKVRETYLRLAQDPRFNAVVIDARQDITEVQQAIRETVITYLR